MSERFLLSGDQAVALAALHAGVARGTGYPGTPSTEILESFAEIGGNAAWAPNEKVALEVALGLSFGGVRTICTMKHVGVNVAADVLFTMALTGVKGGLVLVSADDPGMHSSQNEQDNRRYAVAAAVPMVEPADSQEAYDLTREAFEISERWQLPVILRMTTRVCHSKSIVRPRAPRAISTSKGFERDIKGHVMIPAYARAAHRKLRGKLAEIAAWNESSPLNITHDSGQRELGIITSGICYVHAREAAPDARVLKIGLTYPLPIEKIRAFAASVERCVVIEEGDPILADALRAAGIAVESKAEMYRFNELDVGRVRRILAKDVSPEPAPARGKPPQLCQGCPYHTIYGALKKLDCIVAGDIGCYTLGVLPPYEAMDTCVCMGASITVGLGLRHALPEKDARRVVSVIGDSTFMHSGLVGLAEMVYNPPPTGHVVIILDNGTTAMTGQQEHPGTGRTLSHEPTNRIAPEKIAIAMNVPFIEVTDAQADPAAFEQLLKERLASNELSLIINRKPCILAAAKIRQYETTNAAKSAYQSNNVCASCSGDRAGQKE